MHYITCIISLVFLVCHNALGNWNFLFLSLNKNNKLIVRPTNHENCSIIRLISAMAVGINGDGEISTRFITSRRIAFKTNSCVSYAALSISKQLLIPAISFSIYWSLITLFDQRFTIKGKQVRTWFGHRRCHIYAITFEILFGLGLSHSVSSGN